ncbi:major facilitator superfamily domain-containing protein [Xylariales sp. AK1849]|nr:major facilitator superfamily domain-containing protein [Xylariales sp. AK1849]
MAAKEVSLTRGDGINPQIVTTAGEPGIETEKVKGVEGADQVLLYANDEAIEVPDDVNRRILRKIDWHIMPWLCGLYILQYIDKGVLSYAGVMGLQKETSINSAQYAWVGSIYYVGYIVAAPIHNRLMQRFTPSKHIAVCMTMWGITLACMSACHSYAGLMVQRCFLGALEAAFEHASRVGVWSAMVGVATILGGAIAYGCVVGYETHPNATFTSWKILALCTGLTSTVYGISMYFLMAGSCVTARWLSDDERKMAVERLRTNHSGVGTKVYKRYQAKEAWLDYRTWMYVFYVLASQIPAGGLVLFSSILIQSLGFDTKTTLLLSMPGGLVNIGGNFGFGYLADRTHLRSMCAIIASLLSIFGLALFIGLANVAPLYERYGQLVGYYLMYGLCSTGWYLVISMMSSNVVGFTKKTTNGGIVFAAQGVAYFVGPQVFRDSPYYFKAKYATVGLWVLALLILAGFWYLNDRENKKRVSLVHDQGIDIRRAGVEFLDLTDKENELFRYVI